MVQSRYDTCRPRVRFQLQALPYRYYANRCPIKEGQRRVSEFGESKQCEHWESKRKPLWWCYPSSFPPNICLDITHTQRQFRTNYCSQFPLCDYNRSLILLQFLSRVGGGLGFSFVTLICFSSCALVGIFPLQEFSRLDLEKFWEEVSMLQSFGS